MQHFLSCAFYHLFRVLQSILLFTLHSVSAAPLPPFRHSVSAFYPLPGQTGPTFALLNRWFDGSCVLTKTMSDDIKIWRCWHLYCVRNINSTHIYACVKPTNVVECGQTTRTSKISKKIWLKIWLLSIFSQDCSTSSYISLNNG